MTNPNSSEASRKRAYRKKIDDKRASMVRDILSQFPFKDLQRLGVGSRGVSDIDYGGHFHTLNCTNLNGGKLTIGLCYENDQKSKAFGSSICKNSKKYILLLKLKEIIVLTKITGVSRNIKLIEPCNSTFPTITVALSRLH